MLDIHVQVASDTGCVRDHNEDMILLAGEYYRDESHELQFSLQPNARLTAVVADGMGGHEGGEFASELAVQSLQEFIDGLPAGLEPTDFISAFHQWVQQAHALITQKGIDMPQYNGMGTTLVGLIFYEDHIFSVNVGDSRLYRYRDTFLKQISRDHSLRELNHDPSIPSNYIYNSLGGGGESAFADVEEVTCHVLDNDIYLVCSDGLSDMLTDDEIDALMDQGANAIQLVEAAKAAGGEDNVSVMLIHISKPE